MRHTYWIWACAISFAFALTASATAQAATDILITDGNAAYYYDSASDYGTGDSNAALYLPDLDSSLLYADQWLARSGGVTTRLLDGTASTSNGGKTGTVNFTGVNGNLTIGLTYTIQQVPSGASLSIDASVKNTSASSVSGSLFNYMDYYFGDGSQEYGAKTNDASSTSLTYSGVTDGKNYVATRKGAAANAWQIQSFSQLIDGLSDGSITSLTNLTTPFGPDDVTGALQWNFTLTANQTKTFHIDATAVPEPTSLALVAVACAAVVVCRRRRA